MGYWLTAGPVSYKGRHLKGLIQRGLEVGVLTPGQTAAATAELGLEDSDIEELNGET